MPRPRKPFLQLQVTRHDRKVWYFRRGRGKRMRLPDLYGSAEFDAAYLAALAGAPVAVLGRRQASRGSIKWLIELYRASPAWTKLKPATRKGRETVLGSVDEFTTDELFGIP
jgi:hypothetical protein